MAKPRRHQARKWIVETLIHAENEKGSWILYVSQDSVVVVNLVQTSLFT